MGMVPHSLATLVIRGHRLGTLDFRQLLPIQLVEAGQNFLDTLRAQLVQVLHFPFGAMVELSDSTVQAFPIDLLHRIQLFLNSKYNNYYGFSGYYTWYSYDDFNSYYT